MHSATLISAAGCALARLAFGKLKTPTYVVQERFYATGFLIINENPEFFLKQFLNHKRRNSKCL